jgi:hypothetical protein
MKSQAFMSQEMWGFDNGVHVQFVHDISNPCLLPPILKGEIILDPTRKNIYKEKVE